MTTAPEIPVESAVAAACEAPINTSAPAVPNGANEAEAVRKAAVSGGAGTSADESERDNLMVDENLVKEEEAAKAEREKQTSTKPVQALTKDRLAKLDVLLDKAQMYSKFLDEQVKAMQDKLDKEDDEPSKKRKRGQAAKRAKCDGSVSQTAEKFPLINGELRDYQLKGVKWLISLWTNGMNGILADQMGLGKTVQTITFLSHLRYNSVPGPFLIVVPLSTMANWHAEVKRWCPSMASMIYHGDKKERQQMERKWFKKEYNRVCPWEMPVIITSFEIAIRDCKALSKLHYKYLVVDEGHRLKNSNCLLVRQLKQFSTDNKLLLTGTPLQNNLAELWSLLNFLVPSVFNSLEDFESWFDFSAMVSSNESETETKSKDILEAEAKNRMVSKLHEILKPFLLRRIKADVETGLPAKQEIVLYTPQTKLQGDIQQKLVDKTLITEVAEMAKKCGHRVDVGKLNNLLMQLRKNCNHPDILISEWEPSAIFPPPDELVAQCGKMQLLDRLLSRLHSKGHKVLIFSQFTRMMDVLDAYLDGRGHHTNRIDGSMDYKTRMHQIDEFNNNPKSFVFTLSTRAGGLGLNLTAADTVIIYDSDWNPHQDMQAMDRVHRIGQKKPVLVLRLCTSNSVEIKLLKRATSKLALERLVIKKGAFQGVDEQPEDKPHAKASLSAQELLDVLQGNTQYKGSEQNEAISDEMMAQLLDRKHLANRTVCPYPTEGPGYELIEEKGHGLLTTVE
eukprot:jgi/Ulvmu1/6986/UM033_0044.1